MKRTPTKARGPRQDGIKSREAILSSAREQFALHGYDKATMRGIATEAKVDVALISYYFGSKSELFMESLRLPLNPGDIVDGLLATGTEDLGRRLVTSLTAAWDNPATGEPLLTMLRSSSNQADLTRDFIERQMLPKLSAALQGPDAELRAAAIITQVLGFVYSRYLLRIEPLASAGTDEIVALLGPTIQRYVDGD